MKLFVVVILVLCSIVSIQGNWNDLWTKDCCDPHDDMHLGYICDDGSRAPTIGCCGNGACNVFCCNCDGGCISGIHKPHKVLGVWSQDLAPEIDFLGIGGKKTVVDLPWEMAKTAIEETGIAAYDYGKEVAKGMGKDESGIEYHPWRHKRTTS